MGYAGIIDVPGRPVSDDAECELFEPVETNLAEHHKILLQALEETSRTRYGRLMVFMPRGAAKSTYSSIVFPSKYLGEEGNRRVILASYGDELPRKNGRRTRSIIRQPRYQRLFNCQLSQDSQAADQFSLTNGSEYMATGMLAGVVGNRANGIVIDDPVKNRQAAQSQVQRNATWDAYHDDLLPCLLPGGWLVLVMTRWDLDDMAGRILPEDWNGESGYFDCRDGMRWRVLCLQAKCETHSDPLGRELGEYLWPQWFDRKHWSQFESSPMTWNSMFQQRPRPPEGAFFQKASLLVDGQPVEMPCLVESVFAIVDTAIKTGSQHDGTGVVFFAYSPRVNLNAPLTILDWDYQQIEGGSLEKWLPSIFERLEYFAKECKARNGSVGAHIEDKGSGMILLQQAATHDWPAYPIESKLSSVGKVERASNAEPHVSAGDVKIARLAYERVVTFKGSTRNHFLGQVLGFAIDTVDKSPDDLLDCFSYGIALSLGNRDGF